jgi:hypothetical protein
MIKNLDLKKLDESSLEEAGILLNEIEKFKKFYSITKVKLDKIKAQEELFEEVKRGSKEYLLYKGGNGS